MKSQHDLDHAHEAPSGAEIRDEPPQMPAHAADQNWETVGSRRRKRLSDLDTRSVLIWGVPPSVTVQAIHALICRPVGKVARQYVSSVDWQSAGDHRWVRVTFQNSLSCNSLFGQIQDTCRLKGWKQLKSRLYSQRQAHRRR